MTLEAGYLTTNVMAPSPHFSPHKKRQSKVRLEEKEKNKPYWFKGLDVLGDF